MSTRVMSDPVKNTAEAFRMSLPMFEADESLEAICWPLPEGYVWIRATPDSTEHLSGKEEERRKMYDFRYQRAKCASSSEMPPDSEFNAVMKAWTETHARMSPRMKS